MSDTKAERLATALQRFIRSSPEVEATAVVSFDGLTMASALPAGMDEDRLGAMSAALLSLAEQAASGLGRGELRQLFVEGDHGFVFLMSAKDQAVLASITGRAAKIGLMLYEMRRAAEVIGTVLEQPPGEGGAAGAPEGWGPGVQAGATGAGGRGYGQEDGATGPAGPRGSGEPDAALLADLADGTQPVTTAGQQWS
ncbi:MAG: roadblock/LC7 domain-containing protein [Actinomycetota bacterium]|nr:roadblock/LC7 domain-containing protein [Actinomycetota bacterium]